MSGIHPVIASGISFYEMKEIACKSTTWDTEAEFLRIQCQPRLNAKFEVAKLHETLSQKNKKYKILNFIVKHTQPTTCNFRINMDSDEHIHE